MKATQLLSYKAELDTGNPGRVTVGLIGTRPEIWSVHTGRDSQKVPGKPTLGFGGSGIPTIKYPNT